MISNHISIINKACPPLTGPVCAESWSSAKGVYVYALWPRTE